MTESCLIIDQRYIDIGEVSLKKVRFYRKKMPFMYLLKQTGWVEVICGSMFSGKSEELIRRVRRAQFAKQKIAVFKPKIDNRYHDQQVVSHNGSSFHAKAI